MRVKAGMQRSKAQGENISRPKIIKVKQILILDLKKYGLSMNKISIQTGIPYGTVHNYCKSED